MPSLTQPSDVGAMVTLGAGVGSAVEAGVTVGTALVGDGVLQFELFFFTSL